MVNLFLPGDETEMVGVNHEMNSDGLTVQAHSWISTTSSIAGVRTLPDMAGVRDPVDLETKVDDLHLG